MVNVGFDLLPALLGKKVDAIIGGYEVHEAIVAEQQGQPVNVLKVQDWGVPDYYELVLVTSDKMLKENPEVVRKFLRAATKGYTMPQNQGAALDLLKAANDEADLKVERPAWLGSPPTGPNGVRFGEQTTDRWQRYADWLRANKILDKDVKVADCFTSDYLPK